MFLKIFCLLVLAVVAYGLPYEHFHGANVDPGFSRYPNPGGFSPDAGFGNGHGQGGYPSQVDPGFSHGGQGGLPGHDSLHYGGGDQHGNHQHGYKQYGY